MRAAIVKSGGYLDNIITRILHNNGINGDFITKVSRNTFVDYNVVIFTYQNNIPNISKVIEQITLEKKVQVIYISNTMNIGKFYNLGNEIFFSFIEERLIDVVLPNTIRMSGKFIKEVSTLTYELNIVQDELELIKTTNKAKRILIRKGLSEDESHKFIVNKAMELRIPKLKLANLIIENKIDI